MRAEPLPPCAAAAYRPPAAAHPTPVCAQSRNQGLQEYGSAVYDPATRTYEQLLDECGIHDCKNSFCGGAQHRCPSQHSTPAPQRGCFCPARGTLPPSSVACAAVPPDPRHAPPACCRAAQTTTAMSEVLIFGGHAEDINWWACCLVPAALPGLAASGLLVHTVPPPARCPATCLPACPPACAATTASPAPHHTTMHTRRHRRRRAAPRLAPHTALPAAALPTMLPLSPGPFFSTPRSPAQVPLLQPRHRQPVEHQNELRWAGACILGSSILPGASSRLPLHSAPLSTSGPCAGSRPPPDTRLAPSPHNLPPPSLLPPPPFCQGAGTPAWPRWATARCWWWGEWRTAARLGTMWRGRLSTTTQATRCTTPPPSEQRMGGLLQGPPGGGPAGRHAPARCAGQPGGCWCQDEEAAASAIGSMAAVCPAWLGSLRGGHRSAPTSPPPRHAPLPAPCSQVV